MPSLLILLALLFPAQSAPTDMLRELRVRLVEEINRDRKAAGLQPVEYSEELSIAADAHCREMVRENYMSHWDRAGQKPYMRYSLAGIQDYTSENIWSLWSSNLETSPGELWKLLLAGHRGFMAELPPNDGHRQSILSPRHTHVGIGLFFDRQSLRLMEVFGARYAQLKSLPARATLQDKLKLEGQIYGKNLVLFGVAIYYEALPAPMSREELRATYSYSLPEEYSMERTWLKDGQYSDGSEGSVYIGDAGKFSLALRFWKKTPGVYTIGVWVREQRGGRPFLGAMTSVFVEEISKSSR
jgi:uncharacterized protein YkwD